MDVEIERLSKNGVDEKNGMIQHYETIVESLQHDLKECKVEQAQIRGEINDVTRENLNAVNIVRDAFYHANDKEYDGSVESRECMENLQRQLAIIQLEKDSLFQLWQMALKTVDALEHELKQTYKKEKTTKFYENQVNNVKETYSEAIKTLETKLLQAKENFEKQQVLWQSTTEKISKLNCEKIELEGKLINTQKDLSYKDETYYKAIERLESQLNITKQQLELLNVSKMKLENELMELRCFTTRIVAKNQESKEKVAEAIELVETAVREKEIVLQRETIIINEKTKLEARLANSSDEFAARLDKELSELRGNFEKSNKKYINEIEELKAELRDKTLKMDRAQRECCLVEEELEKVRHGTNNYLDRSNLKILDFEQKFKVSEATLKRKFDDKVSEFENRILDLEQKITDANDRLEQNHICNAKEMDDPVRKSDDKVREAVERYLNMEKRLIRTLDERESVTSELRSLQLTHDREITRRENERRLLENRIRELEDDIRNANDFADRSAAKADSSEKRIELLEKELDVRRNQTSVDNGDVKCLDADRSIQFKIIQEKYEEKISELNRYVTMHQNLSTRWKEEAESMASKFHGRYKELRSKVNILKKENDMLNHELMCWRQQVALCHTQTIQRYDQGDSAR